MNGVNLMFKAGLSFVLSIGSLFLSGPVWGQVTVDFAKLDAYVRNSVAESRATGMAVGIIKDGEVVFARGYGVRNLETKAPVDEHTQFCLGSASKAFIVAAMGILVDEGKLGWQDKVIDHLPWFQLQDPYATREMTIADVLTHRSGLGTFDGDLLWFGTDYSSEEVVRRLRTLPLRSGFRSRFAYSNVMYIVAGLVVEAVSGIPWRDFVEKRVLQVLGMEHSSTTLAGLEASENHAVPHMNGRPLPIINYDNVGPAGSVNASVSDMLEWLEMWLGEGSAKGTRFLSAQTVRTATASQMFLSGGRGDEPQGVHFNNYGFAWRLSDYAGRKIVRHGGALPGWLSEVVFVPEDDLGVVVLVNDLVPIHQAIADRILDLFLTTRSRDYVGDVLQALERSGPVLEKRRQERLGTRIANTAPSLLAPDYVGLYRDATYGDAVVSLVEGGLHLSLQPAPGLFSASLEHFHFDTFKVQFPAPALEFGLVTFHLGPDGHVDTFTIDLPSQDLRFSDLRFVKQREPSVHES